MPEINSYEEAHALFAKARKPEAGKPLGSHGWRMFKDGDEYVVNCYATQVARILPNNTLRVCLSRNPPISVVQTVHRVLRIEFRRAGRGRYRVHADGGDFALSGQLVVDLGSGLAVGYREPEVVVNADARKEWLRNSAALKRHLKVIAKLGVFTTKVDELRNGPRPRWSFPAWMSRASRELDIEYYTAALSMGSEAIDQLVQRLAEAMHYGFWEPAPISDQLIWLDGAHKSVSYDARFALGVIEIKE